MSTTTTPLPPTCTTAIPDPQGYVPPSACNAHYGFYPSWQANLFFAVAFFLSGGAHIAQLLAHRKPFCWVLVTGAVWEHVCFVLRTAGALDQQDGGLVAGGAVLFLLAPVCELISFSAFFFSVEVCWCWAQKGEGWWRAMDR